jgi:hypothetical protein
LPAAAASMRPPQPKKEYRNFIGGPNRRTQKRGLLKSRQGLGRAKGGPCTHSVKAS